MRGFAIGWLVLLSYAGLAQVVTDDTTHQRLVHKIRQSKTSKALLNSVKTHSNPDTLFNTRSESVFMQYSGKIVRHININHIGFDKTIYDTTRSVKNTITRIGNSLHSNTKVWVIKNNLFIREGKALNPYRVADNERYLRDLNFILDARIYVEPVSADSVDLTVVTRDIFSLGASFSPNSPHKYTYKVHDVNVAGWGQQIQTNGLIENGRNPMLGPEFIYSKNSIGGTLTNLSIGYTTLNTGSSYGEENEYAAYVRLNRPLVSPYTRLAGGLEISVNQSKNVNVAPDSLFKSYRYVVNDFWIGYNIGINSRVKNRNRHFAAIRFFSEQFLSQPKQPIERINPLYNNQDYVLGQFTFFNQNFYKTRYIYGFGRTEDVPYGKRFSVLAGWSHQLFLNRLYMGIDFDRTIVHGKGDFYQYSFRAETFDYKQELQDISLLASASLNSRLHVYKHFKIRQSLGASYTAIIKPTINRLLQIDNDFGVSGIRADSVRGQQRLGLHTETVMFTNWKLLGFHFAPLIFGDMAFISKNNDQVFYDKPYYGLGGGMRTRNENLVFGTIEFRGTYFPRVPQGGSHFSVTLRTNLRIKFTGSLINAPSFIQYN
ncbi:MAG TPA: hypothetical protein VL443_19605 [Cyclobacteriaceae bacterium]|nr:hypothetical protein [Cyclobacteriaceae bacterium]